MRKALQHQGRLYLSHQTLSYQEGYPAAGIFFSERSESLFIPQPDLNTEGANVGKDVLFT